MSFCLNSCNRKCQKADWQYHKVHVCNKCNPKLKSNVEYLIPSTSSASGWPTASMPEMKPTCHCCDGSDCCGVNALYRTLKGERAFLGAVINSEGDIFKMNDPRDDIGLFEKGGNPTGHGHKMTWFESMWVFYFLILYLCRLGFFCGILLIKYFIHFHFLSVSIGVKWLIMMIVRATLFGLTPALAPSKTTSPTTLGAKTTAASAIYSFLSTQIWNFHSLDRNHPKSEPMMSWPLFLRKNSSYLIP